MEDLVVIILTLVIAAIGALQHVKKTREAGQQNAQQPDVMSDEVHHEEYSYDWEPETLLEETERKEQMLKEKKTEVMPDVLEQPYQFKAENEGGSINKSDLTERGTLKVEIRRSKKSTGFSLKQAVIFSEILHRKYE